MCEMFYPTGSGWSRVDIVDFINETAEENGIDFSIKEHQISDGNCQRFVDEFNRLDLIYVDEDEATEARNQFVCNLINNVLM